MNNVILLSRYLHGIDKVAQQQQRGESDDSAEDRRSASEMRRDLLVGGGVAAASAVGQGIAKHKKDLRAKARRQAFADAFRSHTKSRREALDKLRAAAAERASAAAAKGDKAKAIGSKVVDTARIAANNKLTRGVGGVGSGIIGGAKTLIKQRLGIDEAKPESSLGRVAKSTGSVLNKSLSAASSKQTGEAFRRGMAWSQSARSLGI